MDSVSLAPLSGTGIDPIYSLVRGANSRFDASSQGLFDALLQVTELPSKKSASTADVLASEIASRQSREASPADESDDYGAEVDREAAEEIPTDLATTDLATPLINLPSQQVQASVSISGETPANFETNAFKAEHPLEADNSIATESAVSLGLPQDEIPAPSDESAFTQFPDQENTQERLPIAATAVTIRTVEGTEEKTTLANASGFVAKPTNNEPEVPRFPLDSDSEQPVSPAASVVGHEVELASSKEEQKVVDADHADSEGNHEERKEDRRRDRRGYRLREKVNVQAQSVDVVRRSADPNHPEKDLRDAGESVKLTTASEPIAPSIPLPSAEGPLAFNSASPLQIAAVSRSFEATLNETASTNVNGVARARPSVEAALRNAIPSTPIHNTPEEIVRASGDGHLSSEPSSEPISEPTTDSAKGSAADRVRLIQRVSRAFQRIGDHSGNIRIRLSPPTLGAVRVEIQLQDTVMNARLVTETEAARSAIQEHLTELQARLKEQGIQIERIEVEKESSSAHSFLGSGAHHQSWSDTGTGKDLPLSGDRVLAQSKVETSPHPRLAKLGHLDVQA